MSRKTLLKLAPFIFVAILLTSTNPIANTSASSSNLSVDIVDAWYSDGEGDGKENDVFAIVYFEIDSSYYWDVIEYEITLTRPSGLSDTYYVTIYSTLNEFNITNNFWNHATESGWYTVSIEAELNSNCQTETDSLTFDPPGGDNSDPKSFSI